MSGRPVRPSFALYLVLGPALAIGLSLAAFTATKGVSDAVNGGASGTPRATESASALPAVTSPSGAPGSTGNGSTEAP